jgi:hypothetical protein
MTFEVDDIPPGTAFSDRDITQILTSIYQYATVPPMSTKISFQDITIIVKCVFQLRLLPLGHVTCPYIADTVLTQACRSTNFGAETLSNGKTYLTVEVGLYLRDTQHELMKQVLRVREKT